MKLTNWFLNFDFNGRARRSHMWANWAAWWGVFIGFFILLGAMGASLGADGSAPSLGAGAFAGLIGLLFVVAAIASFIDSLAMTFRRAHDTGKTGWIWLVLFIPFVNLLALYWLLIEDSQQGPNKYGPPVKQFYQPSAAE